MNRWFRLLASVALLAAAGTPVLAQRSQQIEFGGFGSFIRYDRAFHLKNGFGGGARVGYSLSDRVGIEVEGGFASTQDKFSAQDATLSMASADRKSTRLNSSH